MSRLSSENRITKRQLLSDASKLYDPCGILSPITIISKLIMQKVWKTGVDWDSYVNDEIQAEWNEYKADLPSIENIKIDRWLKTEQNSEKSLHGFCDSSEKAMGAVVYMIQTSNETTTSTLICAKSRVAPFDPKSIPRLELDGAVLLANLMNRVANNLNISHENVHLWTDSSVVLAWLQGHPSKWKTYVGHRVNNIQKLYDQSHWHHVRTNENPADIVSRGMVPSELKNNQLWFFGPSWLTLPSKNWPKLIPIVADDINLEKSSSVRINVVI